MKHEIDFPISFLKQYHLNNEMEFTHQTFDVIYVLSGKIAISSATEDTRIYVGNNVMVLYSNTYYRLTPTGDNIILHMGLKTNFIEKYIGPDYQIICDSLKEPNRNYLMAKKLLSSIASQYLDDSTNHELSIYGQLFQLIDLFSKEYALTLPPEATDINPKYRDRMYKIKEYIAQNYNQPITLSSMADFMHLTPQYLSKFFKSCFSVNFNEYLNTIRIQHAMRDVRYTQQAITDIAINHGFSNISTFNKHFRDSYDISPRDYRRRFHQQTPVDYEWPQENIEVTRLVTNASLDNREVTVQVDNVTPFSHNFCDLINIGAAKNLLSDDFKRHFIAAHKELHFKYVRIEGLVSNSLIPGLLPGNSYHFANILEILDFLQPQNTIPFIELGKNSYDYLQDHSQARNFRGYSSNKKFHTMLAAFLEFVKERYDSSWLEQWIFELWKTPAESLTNYIEAYQIIEKLIHQYLPQAAFGGPGHNTALSSDDFSECIQAFCASNITPSFVSVHLFPIQYSQEKGANNLVLSPAVRSLYKQHQWMIHQIQEFLGQSVPLYITEFNSTLIPQTFINDSCFQATFLCRNLLDFHEDSPLIGYWMLSNLAFSIADPGARMINGISLINQSGIKMPSFHAYSILNKLGTSLIEKGDNFCITKTDENHYQILAYNYAHFTNYQSLLNDGHHSLREAYSYYEESVPVQMNFHLIGLPSGVYCVKRYLLDRYNGSLVDVQLGGLITSTIDENSYLNKIQTPAPQQVQYLSAACVPEERIIYLDIQNELNVKTTIAPHNVCLWDLVREI